MNNEFLFKEGESPKGMVSVSQMYTLMSCPRKWGYSYLEGLAPRVERSYLTIGKLCHKGMEAAMRAKWEIDRDGGFWDGPEVDLMIIKEHGVKAMEDMFADFMEVTPFLDEEIPEQQQLLDDAVNVFTQALEEFDPMRYEVYTVISPDGEEMPAIELHFHIPCFKDEVGLHGYIDIIVIDKNTGHIWCTDYKFRKTLAPDTDEQFNLQNATYAKACEYLEIPITGTMTWQHSNIPAATPSILKSGDVSRTKIRTTWKKYADFVLAQGFDLMDYAEMEEKLADIEWYRVTQEYRNEETIQRMWNEIVEPVASSIEGARHLSPNSLCKYMYPYNCKLCNFSELCQAELRGYDVEYIKAKSYTTRSHR